MIYVVLGMHKSGTTLVAQILHHSGINMVASEGGSYDKGFKYERQSVKQLNEALLGCGTLRSIDIELPRAARKTADLEDRMRQAVAACDGQHADWGFKDPRTCLTYGSWAPLLPPHKLIVVYRPPREIWPRYRSPNPLRNLDRTWRFVESWCLHNERILALIETPSPTPHLVVDYRRLMAGPREFRRIEQFVGRNLDDQRRPALYRNRAPRCPGLTLYSLLHACLRGRHMWAIMRRFEQLRAASMVLEDGETP